jgi:hypothetical protein
MFSLYPLCGVHLGVDLMWRKEETSEESQRAGESLLSGGERDHPKSGYF